MKIALAIPKIAFFLPIIGVLELLNIACYLSRNWLWVERFTTWIIRLYSPTPLACAAYKSRGIARAYRGDTDRAIADCNEVIRLVPGYGNAFIARGIAHLQAHDFAAAVLDCHHAIQVRVNKRNRAVAYLNLGVAFTSQEIRRIPRIVY